MLYQAVPGCTELYLAVLDCTRVYSAVPGCTWFSRDGAWMRSGCGLDAVWVRSGCSLEAVWMRSGCGVNHLSLSKSVLDHYRMVKNIQSYKCADGGWDGYLGDYVC